MERTVLIYLEKDGNYLMLHRNKEEGDLNLGKWLGVGGHIEDGETKEETVVREVKEETNLELHSFTYRGHVMFRFDNYLEEMFVFHSKDYSGIMGECDEGTLKYVPIKDVLKLNLWPSDHFFLEKLIETDVFFDFEFVYKNNELLEVIDCANKQKN